MASMYNLSGSEPNYYHHVEIPAEPVVKLYKSFLLTLLIKILQWFFILVDQSVSVNGNPWNSIYLQLLALLHFTASSTSSEHIYKYTHTGTHTQRYTPTQTHTLFQKQDSHVLLFSRSVLSDLFPWLPIKFLGLLSKTFLYCSNNIPFAKNFLTISGRIH